MRIEAVWEGACRPKHVAEGIMMVYTLALIEEAG